MIARARVPRVLLITDETHAGGLAAPVLDALSSRRGPLPYVQVQLRGKHLPGRALVAEGRLLRERLRALDVPLLVNGRIDVACVLEADGVHLPERGVSAEAVRRLLPGAIISRACHDATGLRRASREHADYAVLSPVFDVPGKNAPLGLDGLRASIAALPIVALGGITHDTVSDVIHAGAHGVAVIRHVLRDPAPSEALGRLLESIDDGLR